MLALPAPASSYDSGRRRSRWDTSACRRANRACTRNRWANDDDDRRNHRNDDGSRDADRWFRTQQSTGVDKHFLRSGRLIECESRTRHGKHSENEKHRGQTPEAPCYERFPAVHRAPQNYGYTDSATTAEYLLH